MRPAQLSHEDLLRLLAEHVAPGDVAGDGIWVRVRMRRLDPGQRSGWKLHLSATPSSYEALLNAALPVITAHGWPFKLLRDTDEVERMDAGERGLMQVGKVLTIYPRDEATAAALAESLRGALRGISGPVIPSDLPYCIDAPIYFRFAPYDGRIEIDAMAQERRLLWRPDLGRDVWDLTSGGSDEMPAKEHLPARDAPDHLAFLREKYRLLRMLQLTAKGGVFIAVENRAEPSVPLLIKTARPGTNSDVHGRDAVWALRREHALLRSLEDVAGLPEAGTLIESSGASAIVRPYLHGETFWEMWTGPAARGAATRARMMQALDEIEITVRALHARGVVVRDISAGNILLAPDRAYLMDLELAHGVDDATPPYRRGTRGFFDAKKPREARTAVEDDWFALRVLREMAEEGTPAVLGARAGSTWERQSPDWLDERVYAPIGRLAFPGGTAAANIYSGIAGTVWGAYLRRTRSEEWDNARALMSEFRHEAERVVHIPGFYFGASGVAVAMGLLGGGDAPEARALLARIDVERSEVPDLCQGVAGYLFACVTLFEVTKHGDFLALAQRAADRLIALASEEDGMRVWRWPVGAFGDLSGAACYGFGHGVAGIVYALLRLQEHAPSPRIADEIARGLETLARVSLPVPGEACAAWWPVSSRDETCWNAWCHGTPGVIKVLARARRDGADAAHAGLLECALRGMYFANNSELCLCHGVASRLDAVCDCLELPSYGIDADTARHAETDARLLRRALALEAADEIESPFVGADGDEHTGLMTGALGAALTLKRFERLRAFGA